MYNINNLYFTDKKSEMIAIGQAFADGYDATWLKEIKDALDCVKDWNKLSGGTWTAEEVFYKAIYDYWASVSHQVNRLNIAFLISLMKRNLHTSL